MSFFSIDLEQVLLVEGKTPEITKGSLSEAFRLVFKTIKLLIFLTKGESGKRLNQVGLETQRAATGNSELLSVEWECGSQPSASCKVEKFALSLGTTEEVSKSSFCPEGGGD